MWSKGELYFGSQLPTAAQLPCEQAFLCSAYVALCAPGDQEEGFILETANGFVCTFIPFAERGCRLLL